MIFMADFSTHAILLRKIEYGDHDFIISFLTESRGKISVIAKNAKKSVKRFTGALDLFSLNKIHCVYPQKNKDALIILSQAALEDGFIHIRSNIMKTAYASFWVEIIHFWLEEKKEQTDIFNLLKMSIQALDKGTISDEVLNLHFQIKVMTLSGFSPGIEHCDVCNKNIDRISQKSIQFDFKAGRILCHDCQRKRLKYGMVVSKGTIKQLFWLNNNDIRRAERIKVSDVAIKEGTRLLEAFIPFHMGREFKSTQFIKKVRQKITA